MIKFDLPTLLGVCNLVSIFIGLGVIYGKLQSSISTILKWQERHEAENKNALDRLDDKIRSGDDRIAIRLASVENKIMFDDGSSRYVRILDCEKHRADAARNQADYYKMLEKMVLAYHAESSAERKEILKVIAEMSTKLNVMIATCELEKAK